MALAPVNTTTASNTWLNQDGLLIKFGTTEGRIDNAGEYEDVYAGQTVLEVRINATEISTVASTLLGTGYNAGIPANAIITAVDIFTETALTSGGTPTLNIGLAKSIDFNVLSQTSLAAAVPFASISTVGTLFSVSSGVTGANKGASAGISIGLFPAILTIDASVAFTAGKLQIRVYFYVPDQQVGGE